MKKIRTKRTITQKLLGGGMKALKLLPHVQKKINEEYGNILEELEKMEIGRAHV